MNEKKVEEMVKQLLDEAEICTILLSDRNGRAIGFLKGTTGDILNNVLNMLDDAIRQDIQNPPRKCAEVIVEGLIRIVERIEHDREMGMQSKQH
jgi:hypothetical protein